VAYKIWQQEVLGGGVGKEIRHVGMPVRVGHRRRKQML